MRAVFMGTPEVAADVLRYLAGRYDVAGVFCQPDKPVGRKQILTPPAVKVEAEALGIPVFQPRSVRKQETLDLVRELAPDLIAVVAYGKILPQALLDIPRYGAFNLHGSLLPKYRGSAPIQRSIMDGQPVGMTVINMSFECDAGDILDSAEIPMEASEDAFDAFRKLGALGGPFLSSAIDRYISGELVPVPQDGSEATFAPMLEKEEAGFTFGEEASAIVNKVRGIAMWPCAEFLSGGRRIKVLKAALEPAEAEPGTVVSLKPFSVAARGGSVTLLRVKQEGGKEMDGTDWARGRRFRPGDRVD